MAIEDTRQQLVGTQKKLEAALLAEIRRLKVKPGGGTEDLELDRLYAKLKAVREEMRETSGAEKKKVMEEMSIQELLGINLNALRLEQLEALRDEVGKRLTPGMNEEESAALADMLEKIEALIAKKKPRPEQPPEGPPPSQAGAVVPLPTEKMGSAEKKLESGKTQEHRRIVTDIERRLGIPVKDLDEAELPEELDWLERQLHYPGMANLPELKGRIENRMEEIVKQMRRAKEGHARATINAGSGEIAEPVRETLPIVTFEKWEEPAPKEPAAVPVENWMEGDERTLKGLLNTIERVKKRLAELDEEDPARKERKEKEPDAKEQARPGAPETQEGVVSFTDKQIEDKLRNILSGLPGIQKINNLNARGVEKTMLADVNIDVRVKLLGPIKKKINIWADVGLVNGHEGIVAIIHDLQATAGKDQVREKIEEYLGQLNEELKRRLEGESGKRIGKIFIEDGQLKAKVIE